MGTTAVKVVGCPKDGTFRENRVACSTLTIPTQVKVVFACKTQLKSLQELAKVEKS
jgi:hypothetical protein